MRRVLGSIAASLFGLTISLFLLEAGFRIVFREDARWSDRPFAYFKAEQAKTLQDYAYAESKPEGGFRIAVVGDSYTFAPYMQFTDAFPKVLERMLNLKQGSQRAEVINYGVPAYSTSHEIESVETALKQGADLVLLQITLNDPELKPYRPVGITEFGRFGDLQLSPRMQRVASVWRSLGFVLTRLHNNKTYDEYIKYFFDLFDNPRSFKKFKESLARIAKLCAERKVKLVAVVFPLFGVPIDKDYPFSPLHQKVAAELESLGTPALDLLSIYQGIPLERLQVIPGGDRHPNEIAHRMAAERIYQWLVQRSDLPEWAVIKELFSDRTRIINEPKYQASNPN